MGGDSAEPGSFVETVGIAALVGWAGQVPQLCNLSGISRLE